MAMPNGRDVGRAEKFEEEKRRIIDSCFGKKDDDGSSKTAQIAQIASASWLLAPEAYRIGDNWHSA